MSNPTPVSKPLPRITRISRPFWDGCNEERLMIQQCTEPACSRWFYFPRVGCPYCGSVDIQWKEVSGLGRVVSHTVIRRAQHPSFTAEIPYYFVAVELAEGPLIYSRLVEAYDSSLNPQGRAVRCVFVDHGEEQRLPFFTLEEAGD